MGRSGSELFVSITRSPCTASISALVSNAQGSGFGFAAAAFAFPACACGGARPAADGAGRPQAEDKNAARAAGTSPQAVGKPHFAGGRARSPEGPGAPTW